MTPIQFTQWLEEFLAVDMTEKERTSVLHKLAKVREYTHECSSSAEAHRLFLQQHPWMHDFKGKAYMSRHDTAIQDSFVVFAVDECGVDREELAVFLGVHKKALTHVLTVTRKRLSAARKVLQSATS